MMGLKLIHVNKRGYLKLTETKYNKAQTMGIDTEIHFW